MSKGEAAVGGGRGRGGGGGGGGGGKLHIIFRLFCRLDE